MTYAPDQIRHLPMNSNAPKPPSPSCSTCCTESPPTISTKQTPCREFDVASLTDHLMNSITVIGGAAGAEMPERDQTDSVERQVVLAARPALDAWKRRGLDGNVAFGSNEAPAKMMAGILSPRIPGPRLGLRRGRRA